VREPPHVHNDKVQDVAPGLKRIGPSPGKAELVGNVSIGGKLGTQHVAVLNAKALNLVFSKKR